MASYTVNTSGSAVYTFPSKILPGDTLLFNYSGTFTSLKFAPGKYHFKIYGARGGNDGGGTGQNGGYAEGKLDIFDDHTFYFYVGGQGASGSSGAGGGYNGGGNAGPSGSSGGGGGATDVRLDGNALINRILVAGGGGGAGNSGTGGGLGGGLTGVNGYNSATNGGKQNAGGVSPRGNGSFGKGGNHTGDGGGGGGGYYGGGASPGDYTGGGGSGFISGFTGCNAVDSTGLHTDQPIHFSGLSFIDGLFTNGLGASHGSISVNCIVLYNVCSDSHITTANPRLDRTEPISITGNFNLDGLTDCSYRVIVNDSLVSTDAIPAVSPFSFSSEIPIELFTTQENTIYLSVIAPTTTYKIPFCRVSWEGPETLSFNRYFQAREDFITTSNLKFEFFKRTMISEFGSGRADFSIPTMGKSKITSIAVSSIADKTVSDIFTQEQTNFEGLGSGTIFKSDIPLDYSSITSIKYIVGGSSNG